MDISAILMLIAMIFIAILLMRLLKNVLLAVFSVLMGAALIVLGISVFIFSDAKAFHDEFYSDDIMVLFYDDGIVAGFDNGGPFTNSRVDAIDINYRPDADLDGIMGDNSRIYVLYPTTGIEVVKYDSAGFMQEYESDLEDEGITYLLDGIRDGDIEIYPESKIVGILKFVPKFVVNMIYRVIE